MRKVMTWLAPVLIVALAVVLILVAQKDDDAGAQNPGAASTPSSAPVEESDPQDPQEPSEEEVADYAAQAETHRVADMARRDENDPLAVGDIDAPVVVVVYSDYQCKFCALWTERTQPELIEDYVETGKLRIEWRDVNIYGDPSRQGSKAVYAAALQDKFRTFHNELFAGGEIRSESELSAEAMIELAHELALDAEQFEIDMRSEETATAVQANEDEGIELGAFSTPSFMINGIPMAGAQPTELFTAIIDNELEEQN